MKVEKRCLNERGYFLRYPYFFADESNDSAEQKEKRRRKLTHNREESSAQRMNGFYQKFTEEIVAYMGSLEDTGRRSKYVMVTEWRVGEEASVEELPWNAEIEIQLVLTLRRQNEPTKRRILIHRWRRGVLVESKIVGT